MVEPVSTIAGATLVALAASKFVEKAAEKAAEKLGDEVIPAALKQAGKQVDSMWQRVKLHFAGNKRAERAIARIEAGSAESPQSAAAFEKLAVYFDDDLQEPENQALADELRQMAQQIINIGQQQTATTFNIDARDEARVNAIGRDVNATTVNFGDGQ
ncbi:MAG: hypothetical protein WBD47_22600 [Phormidesmis sp.]